MIPHHPVPFSLAKLILFCVFKVLSYHLSNQLFECHFRLPTELFLRLCRVTEEGLNLCWSKISMLLSVSTVVVISSVDIIFFIYCHKGPLKYIAGWH